MLGLSGVPAVIMLLGLIFMPESPRWLVSKGNVERAKKVLKRIRKSDDVEDEISDILKTIQKERLGKGCVTFNDYVQCAQIYLFRHRGFVVIKLRSY